MIKEFPRNGLSDMESFREIDLLRNLIIHNRGRANKEYVKLKEMDSLKIGDYISLDEDYLKMASTRLKMVASEIYIEISHARDFYNDGFGTLWSMIFDLTQGSVDVCFSAPTHNKYRSFDLADPAGVTEYPTIIPVKLSRI